MNADWRPVPNFATYEASIDGQIRNVKTGKILKPSVLSNGTGMPCVSLVRNRKVHVLAVRFVVACTFMDLDIFARPKPKFEYIDGDKFNNALSNIRLKQIENLPNEEWRPVIGFETSYAVSSLGRVKRLPRLDIYVRSDTGLTTERPVSECLMRVDESAEYYEINLMFGDKSEFRTVHKMVAKAFIPNPDNLPQVNHIDGNKHNNAASNLEWCTAKENIHHAFATGLRKDRKGQDNSIKRVLCVETGQIFENAIEVSKFFGIPYNYVMGRLHDGKKCHGWTFKQIVVDRRVKCLDTGEIFSSIAAVRDTYHIDPTSSIAARTCCHGYTFCYLRDNVNEDEYLKECRERYSKWPRAEKIWEVNS